MATRYKVEIISDWINYSEDALLKKMQQELDPDVQNLRIIKVDKN